MCGVFLYFKILVNFLPICLNFRRIGNLLFRKIRNRCWATTWNRVDRNWWNRTFFTGLQRLLDHLLSWRFLFWTFLHRRFLWYKFVIISMWLNFILCFVFEIWLNHVRNIFNHILNWLPRILTFKALPLDKQFNFAFDSSVF